MYDFSSNKEDGILGRATIKYLSADEINFEIEVATASGCTGLIEGIAKFTNQGVARYSGSECEELTFRFGKNKLDVDEKHCTNHHGIVCHFARTYYKQNN
ncbi:hypothetical protein [Psychroflexus montanilacus]|uniref:hypothetical protein n=1 Tax=Psychroflexus montanilacus TaxID=2873598 RepID=UPI001CC93E66|nr:hypothetical protein [Psychroflexus montanilacus]MBZ9652670.1 hypothetical protein [Psychroflexus montanilacus]